MIEKLLPTAHHAEETLRRSIVKTISYRVVIIILDFTIIYLFTGKIKVALGFMIVSNIYTTVGYFFHERIWDKIKWGKIIYKKTDTSQETNASR
jgi:adenylylsulfate kinase